MKNVVNKKIEELIRPPFKVLKVKKKTRIKYNFSDGAKRIWNRIKQPA
jgi:hypothetical protein